jgi:hypothetical protein
MDEADALEAVRETVKGTDLRGAGVGSEPIVTNMGEGRVAGECKRQERRRYKRVV